MGLDITAYSRVEFIEIVKDYDAYEEKYGGSEEFVRASHYDPTFADRAVPVLENGIYKVTGEEFGFAAGSYSGYNRWREWLSHTMLGVSPQTVWNDAAIWNDKPFYELINFSDCEGIIGSVVANQLLRDFDENAHKATEDDYNVQKYSLWRRAFALAADQGFVVFH